MNIEHSIERVSRQRLRNWCNGAKPNVTHETTAALEELYARKRLERARSRHGDRDMIVKRARVEREIERLMAED